MSVSASTAKSQPNCDRKQFTYIWYCMGHLWIERGKEGHRFLSHPSEFTRNIRNVRKFSANSLEVLTKS